MAKRENFMLKVVATGTIWLKRLCGVSLLRYRRLFELDALADDPSQDQSTRAKSAPIYNFEITVVLIFPFPVPRSCVLMKRPQAVTTQGFPSSWHRNTILPVFPTRLVASRLQIFIEGTWSS